MRTWSSVRSRQRVLEPKCQGAGHDIYTGENHRYRRDEKTRGAHWAREATVPTREVYTRNVSGLGGRGMRAGLGVPSTEGNENPGDLMCLP